MLGFTYRGKHSYNDFGIIIGNFNIPAVGDLDEYVERLPHHPGQIVLGYTDTRDKIIEITECYLVVDDTTVNSSNPFLYLQQQARKISAWLNPQNMKDYITFDNDAGISYYGMLSDKIDFPTDMGTARKFTIKFRCDPFAYSSVPASAYNGELYSANLPYNSGAIYNQPSTVVTVNGSGSFNLWNGGTAPTYPVLTVTPIVSGNAFSNLTITNNTTNESLFWSGNASTSLVVDNKYKVIYTTSGATQINQFALIGSGDFFSLGANEMNSINVTVSGNVQLSFDYRFCFY